MPQPDDDRRFPYLGIPMRKPKLSAIMAAFFVCEYSYPSIHPHLQLLPQFGNNGFDPA
jgi:hypothetical protein